MYQHQSQESSQNNPFERDSHISERGKSIVQLNPSKLIDISNITKFNQEKLIISLDHCIRCNTCKYSYQIFTPSCPSGDKFLWESYFASGRIRIARALLQNQLQFSNDLIEPIFTCTTCGACQDSCQAVHKDQIVNIIEALRELIVKDFGAPEKHKKLETLIKLEFNPYGEKHSDNSELKNKYQLPDKAEIVYFVGCTSNYRQKQIRDATISVFKKLGINFTLIDEHCCGSPLIRTGQLDLVSELMQYNIKQIESTGAKIVVTSCAGCYKTFKRDFNKFGNYYKFKVKHTSEFLLENFTNNNFKNISKNIQNKIRITYHDPCHLGHHLKFYEPPRALIKSIQNLELREMRRNRENAWCCGAGGGVKIGYPQFALETAIKRIEEALNTQSSILVSTCPFCKTNLNDAYKALSTSKSDSNKIEIIDLIELIDKFL